MKWLELDRCRWMPIFSRPQFGIERRCVNRVFQRQLVQLLQFTDLSASSRAASRCQFVIWPVYWKIKCKLLTPLSFRLAPFDKALTGYKDITLATKSSMDGLECSSLVLILRNNNTWKYLSNTFARMRVGWCCASCSWCLDGLGTLMVVYLTGLILDGQTKVNKDAARIKVILMRKTNGLFRQMVS